MLLSTCFISLDEVSRYTLQGACTITRAGIHGDFFRDSMDVNSREIVSRETSRAMEQREISPKNSRVSDFVIPRTH